MSSRLQLVIIIALVIVSSLVSLIFTRPQTMAVEGTSTTANQNVLQIQSTPETALGINLSAEELSNHSSASDCYIAYQNTVYNITSFVPQLRGGPQIVQYCGQVVDDISSIHPDGSFESPSIQKVLQNLAIGKLTN